MNRNILIMLAIAIIGGVIFNNYKFIFNFLIIPFVFPILFAVLALKNQFSVAVNYLTGIIALVVFDSIRWATWIYLVGYDFAYKDEQVFGMAYITAVVHLVAFSIGFLALWYFKVHNKASNPTP